MGGGCPGYIPVTATFRVANPPALPDPQPSTPCLLRGGGSIELLVHGGNILKAQSPRWRGFPQTAQAVSDLPAEKLDPEDGNNGLTQEEAGV